MRESGRLRFEKGGVLAPIETRIGSVRQKSSDLGVVPKLRIFCRRDLHCGVFGEGAGERIVPTAQQPSECS
jgi:hypothetical protein